MKELPDAGIRERKRTATFRTIFTAAAELALEVGLEHTTVDAISDRANVSPRTFFNYFASKEDAIRGIDSHGASEETIDHLSNHRSDDVLHDVASLVYSVIADSTIVEESRDLRKLVLERYPQLLTRQILRVSATEDCLGPVVAEWLRDTSTNPRENYTKAVDLLRTVMERVSRQPPPPVFTTTRVSTEVGGSQNGRWCCARHRKYRTSGRGLASTCGG